MAVTVEKLAATLAAKLKIEVPVDRLLAELHAADVLSKDKKTADAVVPGISKAQLTQLIAHLKQPPQDSAPAKPAAVEKPDAAPKPGKKTITLGLKKKKSTEDKTQDKPSAADSSSVVTKVVKRRRVKKPLFTTEKEEEPSSSSSVVEDKPTAAAPAVEKNDLESPGATKSTKPKISKDAAAATPAPSSTPKPAEKKPDLDELKPKKRGRSKRSEALQELRDREELEDLQRYGAGSNVRPRGRKRVTVKTRETKKLEHGFSKPLQEKTKEVAIPESITVGDLAQKMAVKAAAVIKVMMGMGVMATINQVIDQETAVLVVEEMGHKVKLLSADEIEESLLDELDFTEEEQVPRAPVVTIMGHVDHGKTSLLDYIRRTKVTTGEAGGITQHIGAYHVETDKGVITFLDTPGHEAFTAMRARGTKCTDIVILVVAADDGVMPQTVEAIQHAKAAEVPIIVAVNKIDKPEADQERIRSELSQHNVISEEWGGDVIFQPVSAKSGAGIDDLLDSIILQADVLELTARADGPAKGVVIESRLDKSRGPVASILVTEGQLNKGDILLAGREYGRVRSMLGDDGLAKKHIGPSMPVEVLGLAATPVAGDDVVVVSDEKRAREVANFRQARFRETRFARQKAANLESLFSSMTENEASGLNVILKADVQGSVEAIQEALMKLATDEVKVSIVSAATGGITESDINLAMASKAVVLGFNVRATVGARQLVEKEGVDMRYYSVIYDLIDEVKSALSGMLAPEFKENIVGLAEVRDVFRSSKLGSIAGCMVTEGAMRRSLPIRVLRDDVVIYEGELESLRRYKDDVAEVTHGKECGIGVKNYNDVKVGDKIETYERVEVKRTL